MFDTDHDQATGLRRLLQRPPLRLLPVAGAFGDAALASHAQGLAQAFAAAGHRTLLVDGMGGIDGMPCTDGILGVSQVTLPARLDDRGAGWLRDLVFSHPGHELALLAAPEAALGVLLESLDAEVLVLCGPDREDLADAYALVKRLSRGCGLTRFRALFVGAPDPEAARRRHRTLAAVAARHLALEIALAGALPVLTGAGVPHGRDARAVGYELEAIVAASQRWRLAVVGAGGRAMH